MEAVLRDQPPRKGSLLPSITNDERLMVGPLPRMTPSGVASSIRKVGKRANLLSTLIPLRSPRKYEVGIPARWLI